MALCLLDVGRLRVSDPGQLLAPDLETSAHLICTSYPWLPTPAVTILETTLINFIFKRSNYPSGIILIKRRKGQAALCGLQIQICWHLVPKVGHADVLIARHLHELFFQGRLCNQERHNPGRTGSFVNVASSVGSALAGQVQQQHWEWEEW